MLLSRFWYVLLALGVGFLLFLLALGERRYNRSGDRAMREALAADSSAVGWYLKDDARNRAAALIPVTFHPDIQSGLGKATGEAKPSREARDKTRAALKKAYDDIAAELKPDALWAVDAGGRVIADVGYQHSEDWELGGYSVVADALHGWIRDDAWVWKGRIYRVVARPVEREAGSEPVGAIVGAKIVDDLFARAVSKRTDSAVAFYAEGVRVASGAPDGFDKANLDVITQDLKKLEDDADYKEKGRTEARVIGEHLGVVYARLPGETWELGAGYAVGRLAVSVGSFFDFYTKSDNTDRAAVPTLKLIGAILGLALIGLFLSFMEHTRPLSTFRADAAQLAAGKIDVLAPSRFRGIYKKIAADINEGVEKVAAKGGGPRRAADMEQVLGPIPAAPSMSAFSVPGQSTPGEPPPDRPSLPRPSAATPSQRGAPRLRQSGPSSDAESIEASEVVSGAAPAIPRPPGAPPPRKPPPPPGARNPHDATLASPGNDGHAPVAPGGGEDEMTEWRRVYEEFIAIKKQCGEPTQALTFEKFQGTLQRNKDALVARHACARVKFTVYVKDGKAALKASPVK